MIPNDPNEYSSFNFKEGITITDENNNLKKLDPEERKERLLKNIKSDTNEYGILSLCESKKEIRMWNQYADVFNGVCIGFDWDEFNLFFYGSYPLQINLPRRVTYQETLEICSQYLTPEQWIEIFCSKLPKFFMKKNVECFIKRENLL